MRPACAGDNRHPRVKRRTWHSRGQVCGARRNEGCKGKRDSTCEWHEATHWGSRWKAVPAGWTLWDKIQHFEGFTEEIIVLYLDSQWVRKTSPCTLPDWEKGGVFLAPHRPCADCAPLLGPLCRVWEAPQHPALFRVQQAHEAKC